MNIKALSIAIALCVPASFAVGGAAGGSGPVQITRLHGDVFIKPLGKDCTFRTTFGAPEQKLKGGWMRPRKGEYIGDFLLKTGKGSWVHLNERAACVDANSLVVVGSWADISLSVRKGSITAVDGKKGPAICKAGQTRAW